MHRLALPLVLAACATPEVGSPPAPPPPLAASVDLIVGALPAGTTVPLQVIGAPPGATAYVLRGRSPGPGPCPPSLAGDCLGLTAPQLVGSALVGPDGAAIVWVAVPPAIPTGVTLTLQGGVVDPSSGQAALTPVRQRRALGRIDHVVIVGVDGLGGAFLDGPATPVLDSLLASGSYTLAMQNALPTSSSTNWMSMIAGSGPDQHGVTSNGWQPGDSLVPPTLVAAVRAARPTAKIGVFHDWGDFGRLVEPGVADVLTSPGDERQTLDAAVVWMVAERPALTFVHLDHVDHAGHAAGWGSATYDQAAQQADDLVGDLVSALQAAGMWDRTALLVSSDHGGRQFSHGGDTGDERAIPYVLTAPGLVPGLLPGLPRVWDIPATSAALLGTPLPPGWIGRPLGGTTPDPGGTLSGRLTTDYAVIYEDIGSGAVTDVSFWRPVTDPGEVHLGDVGLARHGAPLTPALVVQDDPRLLRAPVAYELVWSDAGSPSQQDVALWQPIPPEGFVCLGTVAMPSHGAPPDTDDVRCVHAALTRPASRRFVWTDTGSRATWDGAVWACDAQGADLSPGTFVTRRHASDPGANACFALDANRVATP